MLIEVARAGARGERGPAEQRDGRGKDDGRGKHDHDGGRPVRDGQDLGWQERALCAQTGPELFFPEAGGSVQEAKRICRACEERAECLEYALANDERFGVWGGLSENERKKLRRGD